LNTFDATAELLDTLAKAEQLFPIAAIWNDWLGSALVQVLAELGAIVGLVAEHPVSTASLCEQALYIRAIVCFTSDQRDGNKQ
jgi:hypothetical protein